MAPQNNGIQNFQPLPDTTGTPPQGVDNFQPLPDAPSQAAQPTEPEESWAERKYKKADQAVNEFLAPNPQNYDSGFKTNVYEAPKTLGREVYSAGKTALGMIPGIYHAFADEATPEEKEKYAQFEAQQGEAPGTETSGAKRIGLGIQRISGLPDAEAALKAYGDPNTRPSYEDILSVAPEAIGTGAGVELGAKGIEKGLPAATGAAQRGAAAVVNKAIENPRTAGAIIGGTLGAKRGGLLGAGIGAIEGARGTGMASRSLKKLQPVRWGEITPEGTTRAPLTSRKPLGPEAPPADVLQASPLARVGQPVPPEPASALGRIPVPQGVEPEGKPAPVMYGPPKPAPEVLQAQALNEGGKPTPQPQSAPLATIPYNAPETALSGVPTPTEQPAAATGEALGGTPLKSPLGRIPYGGEGTEAETGAALGRIRTPKAAELGEVKPTGAKPAAQTGEALGEVGKKPEPLAGEGQEITPEEAKKSSDKIKSEKTSADLKGVANEYNKSQGRGEVKASEAKAHPKGKEIADAYEKMEHNPNSPEVKASYEALKNDVDKQWDSLEKAGYKLEPWNKEGQPYKNSKEMMNDVNNNKHLYFFQGGDMPQDHPLAAKDEKTGLTYNDKLRAVHDAFGHAMSGHEFGPKGEEGAYGDHAQMFSKEAIPALTTETRGQNNWVNNGPHMRNEAGEPLKKGEPGYLAPADRPFAQQKAGILPEEFHAKVEEPKEPYKHDTSSVSKEQARKIVEDIGSKKNFAVLQSENPNNERISDEDNAKRTEELFNDLKARGYEPVPVEGNTKDVKGETERAFYIPDMKPSEAIELGKKYGQYGVFTNKGLHVLGDGTVLPIKEGSDLYTGEDARNQQYYTKVGDYEFSAPLEENAVKDPAQTPTDEKSPIDHASGVEERVARLSNENLRKLAQHYGLDPKEYDFSKREALREGGSKHPVERIQLVKDIMDKMPDEDLTKYGEMHDELSSKEEDLAKSNKAKAEESAKIFSEPLSKAETARDLKPRTPLDNAKIEEKNGKTWIYHPDSPEFSKMAYEDAGDGVAKVRGIAGEKPGHGQQLYDTAIRDAAQKGFNKFEADDIQSADDRAAWQRLSQKYDVQMGPDGTAFIDLKPVRDELLKGQLEAQGPAPKATAETARMSPEQLEKEGFTKEDIEAGQNLPKAGGGAAGAAAKATGPIPEEVGKYVTPLERGTLKTAKSEQTFMDRFMKLPSVQEFVDIGNRASGERKWYQRSQAAIDAITKEAPDYFNQPGDKDRFTDMIAASSPQQPVNENLNEALRTWKRYVDEGRPEGKKLERLLYDSMYLPDAKVPNTIKGIEGKELWDETKKENFKVPSFSANLKGFLDKVTNDGWMAAFAEMKPAQLGKPSAYHPLSAITRMAAEKLGWEPAEAQAAIWAFVKTLTEKGETSPEGIRQYSEDMADILRHDEKIRSVLGDMGVKHAELDKRLDAIERKPEVSRRDTPSTGDSIKRLAERLERQGREIPKPKEQPGLSFEDTGGDTSFNPEELEDYGPKKSKGFGKAT